MNLPFTSRCSLLFLLLLMISPSFSQTPVLVPDSADLYPFVPDTINLLANDQIPAGDSVWEVRILHLQHTQSSYIAKGIFAFSGYQWGFNGVDTGSYWVRMNNNKFYYGKLHFRIHDHSFTNIDVNNINALIRSYDFQFCSNVDSNFWLGFNVPKNSKQLSVFSSSLWIGGKTQTGKLHFANNHDFSGGPVMCGNCYTIYTDTLWNYVWKLNRNEIDYHRQHWWEPDYAIPHDILTWPGNGDTTLGQAWHLAPFSDRNGNGIYEPRDGDYPEVRGDQTLYTIFNDDHFNHFSQGAKLKAEVHLMAYAFALPSDSTLNNTVFLQYRIYNRSDSTYDSTFIGNYTDTDIGYAKDDFMGCDVERNMGIGYNGKPTDGTGQVEAYGDRPPAQGILLLFGPLMDPDGIDNSRYDSTGHQLLNYSVNGMHFGDNVSDNERFGMTSFMCYQDNYGPIPDEAPVFYKYLQGRWRDGSQLHYFDQLYWPTTTGYGPPCRFIFPGNSDSVDWGTAGWHPDQIWNESTAGNNPDDRRFLQNMGPFTFKAGDVQEIDLAYVWARDYVNPYPASNDKLRNYADQVIGAFNNNLLSNGQQIYGVNELPQVSLSISPNPAKEFVVVDLSKLSAPTALQIIDINGKTVMQLQNVPGKARINISNLPEGIYVVKATNIKEIMQTKLIIKK